MSREFNSQELAVYSGLLVLSDKQVLKTICVKEVGDLDYGGDYCVFIDGSWKVLGPDIGIGGEIEEEYFANPLENDPSFDSLDHDYREAHRAEFRQHRSGIQDGR